MKAADSSVQHVWVTFHTKIHGSSSNDVIAVVPCFGIHDYAMTKMWATEPMPVNSEQQNI